MNKKLISFLAATAMIVTVSQESMALVKDMQNIKSINLEESYKFSENKNNYSENIDNIIEVYSWQDIVDNINKNDKITLKLMNSISATSTLNIKNKEITLITDKSDISIERVIKSNPNDTPILFELDNSKLNIIGGDGEKRIKILDKIERKDCGGIIEGKNKSSLKVYNTIFEDIKYRGEESINGSIKMDDANIEISNVEVKGCTGSEGVFLKALNSDVKIDNSFIHDNILKGQAHQATIIYTMKCNVEINNCHIENNDSEAHYPDIGANMGMLCFDTSTVSVKNSEIKENTSTIGVGIASGYSKLTMDNVKIENNKAISFNSGDLYSCQGVGLYVIGGEANIYNTEIKSNTGGSMGGGIYAEESVINLESTSIENNEATSGGGIFASKNSIININHNVVINNNKALNYDKYPTWIDLRNHGGGITNYNGTVNINSNCKIDGNTSEIGEGDAIYQSGALYLGNNPEIKGEIYLPNDKVINIKDEFIGTPVLINMDKDKIDKDNCDGTYQEGRNVIIYDDKLEQPNLSDKKLFVLDNNIKKDGYSLRNEEKVNDGIGLNKNILELFKRTDCLIEYKFKSKTSGKELDKKVLDKCPTSLSIKIGKDAWVPKERFDDIKVTDGIWKFKGWDKVKVEKVTDDVEFIGYWEFIKNSTGGGGGGTIVTPPTDPDRIEGNDRIETSVETSKDLYPNGTNAVVLANAERYTDVLTADPFAIQEKASALLTYKYELPEKTLKEIERLGAKKIYISGGYDAVSKKVVDELAAKGYEIFRFDGVDRYDTARKIAIKIREKGNTNAAELASGEDFPDALCMTPLAVKDCAPILLTKKDSIPKYTKQALAEWDIENIKIGGLEKAVSTEVEKQLKSGFEIDKNNKKDSNVYDGAKAVKRIGGEDRYETSAKLAKESYPDSKLGVYATGEDFPDALIAGNYAGTKEASVLLVKCDSLPEPIEKYTKESKIKKATIIGGVNAVSDKVFNLIKAIINR
ncbi:cell wall-binding repeat-containing protein [Peptacetobacter sp.]|uniref:cell wall-binding repeat-containing protein n=1 Tax=Peptacetobacter sp. TaxID=2991975 RepID=UPI003AB1ED38